MKELINWIKNKKQTEDELDSQDKMITTLQVKIAKLHGTQRENKELKKQNDKYLIQLKDLRKKYNKLKKEVK